MSTLKIGIVSETLVQQHYLRHAIEESGCTPSGFFLVHEVLDSIDSLKSQAKAVDAWLIDVDMERVADNEKGQIFERWVYDLNTPVIFGEGTTFNATEEGFVSWTRQLKRKLLDLSGQLELTKQEKNRADFVWVLAASTGGPDTVKLFLENVEKDLGICFIYAQHIDTKHNRSLGKMVTKNSSYDSCIASHGDVIRKDTVMVIPAENAVDIQPNGTIVLQQNSEWGGDYKPSIDQVIANVGKVYGERSGVIMFTGMGDDGAMGCRLMSLRGGQVWSQSLEDCAATSMPKTAVETGCVTKTDSPKKLAAFLRQYIRLIKKTAIAV